MWISRRVYNELLKQHEKQIAIMAAWIEQLQVQQGVPLQPVATTPQGGSGPPPPEMAMYISDDESDLREARAQNLIDDDQLEEGLRQLGFLNQEVVSS